MHFTYALLRKYKDSNYYTIISIINLSVAKAQFLQLDNYDLAFRIDDSAVKLYESAVKDGKIILINLEEKSKNIILPEDFLILSKEEFLKFRKSKINEEKTDLTKEDFSDEDLYYEYIFEKEKNLILEKIQGFWFPSMSMLHIMYMLDYIEAQLTLFSRGYVITEDNKEDIFIEIIEKDDDDLIEVLEKYIESKDQFLPIFNTFKFFKKVKEEFDEISYWDFDSYEEAKEAIYKIAQKYNQYYMTRNVKSDKELFQEIIKKLKEDKKEENKKDENE